MEMAEVLRDVIVANAGIGRPGGALGRRQGGRPRGITRGQRPLQAGECRGDRVPLLGNEGDLHSGAQRKFGARTGKIEKVVIAEAVFPVVYYSTV